jgi:hypothetical protein
MDSGLNAASLRRAIVACLLTATLVARPAAVFCQRATAADTAQGSTASVPTAEAYVPITPTERVRWVLDDTFGPRSLLVVTPTVALWGTLWNTPIEWGSGGSGVGKRYAHHLADVGIPAAIETALGAITGEEPRYIPSGRKGIWPRVRYAAKTVVLVQRRDGSLKPAWSRLGANLANDVIENTWLPPSMTTGRDTAWRTGAGVLGRLAGNVWQEFWPDLSRTLRKNGRGLSSMPAQRREDYLGADASASGCSAAKTSTNLPVRSW